MSAPFVAEIRMFGCNFPPRGWAFCDGQLLPISQNTALFSLVGTFYGGDGKSTFGLPDLQGRTPLGQGQGSGLSLRDLGEQGGAQTVTLLQTEMPSHTHRPNASTATGDQYAATSGVWSETKVLRQGKNLYAAAPATTQMSPLALTVAGASLPHNNLMPCLTLNFCIAMQGIFPPRP
jgi:microcystin-dependent protein